MKTVLGIGCLVLFGTGCTTYRGPERPAAVHRSGDIHQPWVDRIRDDAPQPDRRREFYYQDALRDRGYQTQADPYFDTRDVESTDKQIVQPESPAGTTTRRREDYPIDGEFWGLSGNDAFPRHKGALRREELNSAPAPRR